MIGVKMLARKGTRRALDDFAGRGARAANLGTQEIGEFVLETVVESIRGGTKSGIVYRRYNPFRIHQASAPGQAPADDLGNLANSYSLSFTKLNQFVFSATVSSYALYAARLEYGDGPLLARPHLTPAVEEAEQVASAMLVDAWNRS